MTRFVNSNSSTGRGILNNRKNRKTNLLTRSKVDNYVEKEECVWETIKGNPSCGEVIVEKWDGYWQHDEIRH